MSGIFPSSKPMIQNLQDSELIRIFLEFVQKFKLQYEKISKEISYKCYEATWVIATHKATGYGRTESEAYKHALRNLLEAVAEQQPYRTFFADTFKQNSRPRPTFKKEALKTEGEEPEKQNQLKMYESSSKMHQMATKKNPYPEIKKRESSMSMSIHHSKICLNKSQLQEESCAEEEIGQARKKIVNLEEKLRMILVQNEALREQLNRKEGSVAQQSLITTQQKPMNSQLISNPMNSQLISNPMNSQKLISTQQVGSSSYQDKSHQNNSYQNSNYPYSNYPSSLNRSVTILHPQSTHGSHLLQSTPAHKLKEKVTVPKLKLDILPNYHKKSGKSLNESLMAAYHDKHDKRVF